MNQAEEKEMNAIQITENYRITCDNRNIILQERYEKKLGKGRHAEGSGAYDYKDLGCYGNMQALANALIHREVIASINEVKGLEEIVEYIDKVKEEIFQHLNSHITIDLGENSKKAPTTRTVKGMKIDVFLENEDD